MKTENLETGAALDKWLKVLGYIMTVVAFCWTVYTFKITSEFDARKPFLEQRLKVYSEAVSIAGVLGAFAERSPEPHYREAELKFHTLLEGQLRAIATTWVYSSAENLYEVARVNLVKDPEQLRSLVKKFADACREDLESSWKTP